MTVKIMNQIKFVLFMTLTLLLTISGFASAAFADTNLVANPGFESGSTRASDWNFITVNGNTPLWDTISYNGLKSIKISVPGTNTINSGYLQSNLINVEPLQNYSFSAWGKTDGAGGNSPSVIVSEIDINGRWLRQTRISFSTGTNNWIQKFVIFQTYPNTAKVYIDIIGSGYGNFWVDDVEFKLKGTSILSPIPVPTSTLTPDTNLVTNPGFEIGSYVPSNWVLVTVNGNTPLWDTISYNGLRSIKISVPGTNTINSGYLQSKIINVEPLQYYTFSAWGKTDGAGDNSPAVTVSEIDINGKWLRENRINFGTGSNNWIQRSMDFKTDSNTAKVYIDIIGSRYGTFWVDDTALKLKSLSTPVPAPEPNPTSTTLNTIKINTDKTISINGKKTFPVFMYYICNPYFESYTGVEPCNPLKNSEFLYSGGGENYQNFITRNLKNTYEATNVFYSLNAGQINDIPQELINSPNFFGYQNLDEASDDMELDVSSNYNKVKAKDPLHPVIINHYENMDKWSKYGDIVSWDIYTIKDINWWPREDSIYAYEQWSEQNFFRGKNLNSIGKPVWALLQANGIQCCGLSVPTPKEVRANTYTAITMDVKGIGYWGYESWGGSLKSTPEYPYGTIGLYNNDSLHNYYRQVAREIKSINDILVLPTKDYSWYYNPGTNVKFSKILTKNVLWKDRVNFNYILKQSGTATYLIVVNKDSRSISDVGITINGLTGSTKAQTLGLETSGSGRAGRMINVNNGQFTDSFDGYAVHIYQIS